MRRPRQPGAAVDNNRIASWLSRFPGYRRNVTRARIREWIEQFDAADRDLAARVLDCVLYVSHEAIDDAFRSILSRLPGWHKAKSRRSGKWRFVAFSRAAGESGHTMLHKLRSATGLSSNRYDELFIDKRDLLHEQLSSDDTVVFLDDFAGTGQQVSTGWREVMTELLPGSPKAYLVLVAASSAAVRRIRTETPLKVAFRISLGQDDNFFSPQCTHFPDGEKDTVLDYCSRADRRNPRGFGNCGFLIVLAHKTPNNSIPILHTNHPRWVGLFPRY